VYVLFVSRRKQPLRASSSRANRRRTGRGSRRRRRRSSRKNVDLHYDPKSNTIVKHIHNHIMNRLPAPAENSLSTTASVATLQRAYRQLCRLERALIKRYNYYALHTATPTGYTVRIHRTSSSPLRRRRGSCGRCRCRRRRRCQCRRVARKCRSKKDRTVFRRGKKQRSGAKKHKKNKRRHSRRSNSQIDREADELRNKYDRHLKAYHKARKLIKQGRRWLRKNRHHSRKNSGTRRVKHHTRRLKKHLKKRRKHHKKKHHKKRSDKKPRFSQLMSVHTTPIEGLDYNRSPLVEEVLKKLEQQQE